MRSDWIKSDRSDRRAAEQIEADRSVGSGDQKEERSATQTAIGEAIGGASLVTARPQRLQCSVLECALSAAGVGPVERHERVVVRQIALEELDAGPEEALEALPVEPHAAQLRLRHHCRQSRLVQQQRDLACRTHRTMDY